MELNFVVLLNFDNVLEAPRSARRNHHCDIGFSHELDFCGERNADSISLSSSKLTISLILFKSKWLILYAGRVSCELRNRPRSPWSLCGSVEEHRSAESDGLRLDSSWGLRIFLCPTLVPRRITSFSNI